jgi:hypothetical protein
MNSPACNFHEGEDAILATMHGKERVISPLLEHELGLRVSLADGLDTDRFGAFTREVERTGSQLDAARAKIAEGFDYAPSARVGIASERSFGPHPYIPFLPLGRELVFLIDRKAGFELIGLDADSDTNFGHAVVTDVAGAMVFAERSRFPEHGLIVMGCADEQPAPHLMINKDITDSAKLEVVVKDCVASFGRAFVETDMRAHRNPTRMAAIGRATEELIRRFLSTCPACAHPGFDVTERIPGIPCAWCATPTDVIRTEVLTCAGCGHRSERPATDQATADPGQCGQCNP